MHQSYQTTFTTKKSGQPCPTCKGAGELGAVVDQVVVDKIRCVCDRCGAPSRRLAPTAVEGAKVAEQEQAPEDWTRVASADGTSLEEHLCPTCAGELELPAGVITVEQLAAAAAAHGQRLELAAAARAADAAASDLARADHAARRQELIDSGHVELAAGMYTARDLLQILDRLLADRGL